MLLLHLNACTLLLLHLNVCTSLQQRMWLQGAVDLLRSYVFDRGLGFYFRGKVTRGTIRRTADEIREEVSLLLLLLLLLLEPACPAIISRTLCATHVT